MSKSERVTAAQQLAVLRMVNECRELGADAGAWQQHLARGVARLTGARFGTAGVVIPNPRRADSLTGMEAEGDWPSSDFEVRYRAWLRDPTSNPALVENPVLIKFVLRPEPELTVVRRDLIPDRNWVRDKYVQEHFYGERLDDGLLSRCVVPVLGAGFNLSATRFVRDPFFTRRECRVVEFLQQELLPYLGRELLLTTQPNLRGLSPRLREVLASLLDGDSEKLVSVRLKIHPTTVHDHVKRLYRHFGVNSRPELMAYFLRRYRQRPDSLAPPPG